MKYLRFLIFFTLSCNSAKKEQAAKILITDTSLLGTIKQFTAYVVQRDQKKEIISVFFNHIKDSVSITLINFSPDLKKVKLIGTTHLDGSQLYFVGNYIPNPFFNILDSYLESTKVNNKTKKDNRLVSEINIEPIVWSFKFKGGHLVHFSPPEVIRRNCPKCMTK